MENVLDNIVAMVKQHPTGIPLKKLAVFYNQTYCQNLTLSSLGFDSMATLVASLNKDLVVQGELVIHKNYCRARQARAAASTKAPEDSKNTEVLKNVVAMVKQNSAGIPVKKLSVFYNQTYHENLTLSSLGFDSVVNLVTSLDRDLVLVGQLVLHKDHYCESSRNAKAGTSAKATEGNDKIEKVLENVLTIMKDHPDGIPLMKLPAVYSQKYHNNLVLTSLGFKSVSGLVTFLNGDLVVRGEVVFHKSHQPPSEPVAESSSTKDSRFATPQRAMSHNDSPSVTMPKVDVSSVHVPLSQAGISFLGPPSVSSTLSTATWQPEKLTQLQLYQRVIEVSEKDKMEFLIYVLLTMFLLSSSLNPVIFDSESAILHINVGLVHILSKHDENDLDTERPCILQPNSYQRQYFLFYHVYQWLLAPRPFVVKM